MPTTGPRSSSYDWPGNVRELESAIVRALPVARRGIVEAGDLGLPGLSDDGGGLSTMPEVPCSYKTQKRRILEAFERQYLPRLMTEVRGNLGRAARAAGKERRGLGQR